MPEKARLCCGLLLGLALAVTCCLWTACDDEAEDEDAGPDAAYTNDEVENWAPEDEGGGGGGDGPGDDEDPGGIPGPGPGGPGPDPP